LVFSDIGQNIQRIGWQNELSHNLGGG